MLVWDIKKLTQYKIKKAGMSLKFRVNAFGNGIMLHFMVQNVRKLEIKSQDHVIY